MIFSLALALCAPLCAAGLDPADWVEATHPAYAVLKLAAEEAGLSGWEVERLQEGLPLPQASARLLAAALRRDPRVDANAKRDLARLLPSEVALAQAQTFADASKTAASLDALDAHLKAIQASLSANNYSPSTPLGLASTYETRYELFSASGLVKQDYAQVPVHLRGDFQGQSGIGTYKFTLDYYTETDDRGNGSFEGILPYSDSQVSLLSSPFGIENVQVVLGFNSLLLSKFIYAAPTYPYESPFYQAGAKLSLANADSPNGERNSQGLYVRKQGSQGAWIFNDFQFFAAPEAEAYEPFNHHHGYESALRADLPGLGWIPGTESTVPYLTLYYYGNDATQLGTFQADNGFYDQPIAYPEQSFNEALGFESQLSGGGTLIAELAASSDSNRLSQAYPYLKDSSYADEAYYFTLTKSLGKLILGVEGSDIGPYFVPGGHSPASQENRDSGMALDTLLPRDYRNGAVDSAWVTVSEDPAWLTNNSQRAAFQASWLDSWGSLGFHVASSRQIDASGPWVKGANFFNNSPYNGFAYSQMFFNNYTYFPTAAAPDPTASPGVMAYDSPTTSAAYEHGVPVKSTFNPYGQVRWDDLEQLAWRNVTQTIWLSRKGVGDPELMDDSVKVYNSFRGDLSLELGSFFGSSRKAHLQLFEEIRDTAESLRFALGAQPDLLLQTISGADLIWQFAPSWQAVATAGHETWDSDASYYPVRFSDDTAGLGLDALLTRLVDGLQLNLRLLAMRHGDATFQERDFSAMTGFVGATYVFNN
jgi:hypothetical protein